MSQILVAVGGFALLFVAYGLLQRGRERASCGNCSCHGGTCERTGEPRDLELLESPDARS
jgi:hypothetical protein